MKIGCRCYKLLPFRSTRVVTVSFPPRLLLPCPNYWVITLLLPTLPKWNLECRRVVSNHLFKLPKKPQSAECTVGFIIPVPARLANWRAKQLERLFLKS